MNSQGFYMFLGPSDEVIESERFVTTFERSRRDVKVLINTVIGVRGEPQASRERVLSPLKSRARARGIHPGPGSGSADPVRGMGGSELVTAPIMIFGGFGENEHF